MNDSAEYMQEAFGRIILKRIYDKIDRSLTEFKNGARRNLYLTYTCIQ